MASNYSEVKFPLPKPLRKFLDQESSGGLLMMLAAFAALVLANGAYWQDYLAFTKLPVGVTFADIHLQAPLKTAIKNVLMVLFFLLVGLELKREFSEGFLAQRDQVLLPLVAAIAGMAMPAAVYFTLNANHPEFYSGWAIASATDIAFALAVLLLAGKHVPSALKVFLLAIAIFDDLGAILVIALFYSGALSFAALGMVALGVVALYGLNRLNVPLITPYILVGIYLCFMLHEAGIHTTLAGVIVGLALPMRCMVRDNQPSPVNHAIHALHPWVSFVVLPLFAFTAAGVHFKTLSLSVLLEPLPMSIATALVIGKQLGIFGATYALVKLGFARLPEGVRWVHVYGVSILAGIGFTMSLFIGYLAFDPAMMDQVKVGVLGGSFVSAILGALVFLLIGRKKAVPNA